MSGSKSKPKPVRVEAKTFGDFLAELAERGGGADKSDPRVKELVELMRKYGLIGGALEWLRRHPEQFAHIDEAFRDVPDGEKLKKMVRVLAGIDGVR